MDKCDTDRFYAKTARRGACLVWIAARDTNGRGRFWLNGKIYAAPRIAWEIAHGGIAEGMCVCHTCDHPACVELSHLFLGTQRDNMHDMQRKGHGYKGGAHNPWNRGITHCKRGHPLSGENLMVSCGRRVCRTCARANYIKNKKQRAERAAMAKENDSV